MRIEPEWVWTPNGLLEQHGIEWADGQIVGVSGATRHPEALQLPGHLVLPGFVNAHSHAFQRAFRGHVQWRASGQDDFWSWRQRMYQTANELTPEGVYDVSYRCFSEMVDAGITHVGEFHYLHHQTDGSAYDNPDELAQRVIAAAHDAGLRITLLRAAYGRCDANRPLLPEQRRFRDSGPESVLSAIQRLKRHEDDRTTIGLAPHSVRAVPPAWLEELSAFDGLVHAHVAEQPSEVASCLDETGQEPLQLLAAAGLVHSRFTAVHLTHPHANDARLLSAANATVCACPFTELDLGDGFLPLSLLDQRLCIGSDSHAIIHPLAEARAIELHARGLSGRRNVMAPMDDQHGLAKRILTIATTNGSRALGAGGLGITPGAPADLVALDLRRPAAEGVPPLEAAAFVSTPEWVSHVWVAGEPIRPD
jgi:formimidoylglutamate deiminase